MNEKEFNEICAEAEKLDPNTYNAMISMKTKSVLEGFTKVTGDKKSARDLFMLLVLGATVSDGGFSGILVGLGQEVAVEIEDVVCMGDTTTTLVG